MKDRSGRPFHGALREGLFLGAVLFGMLFFTFPLEPVAGADYMTLVPLAGRLAFSGLLIPLCVFPCALQRGRGAGALYGTLMPRSRRPVSYLMAALVGPLVLMPLLARSAARLLCALAGRPDSALLQVLFSAVLLAAAALWSSGLSARSARSAAAAAIGLLAAAAAVLCTALLPAPEGGPVSAGAGSWVHLEDHVVLPLAAAFLLSPSEGDVSSDTSLKTLLKHRWMKTACVGCILTALASTLAASCLLRIPAASGSSLAETLARQAGGGLPRILTALAVLLFGVSLLAVCLKGSLRELALPKEGGASRLPDLRILAPLLAFLLTLPGIGGVWMEIASSLLVASYPIFAVPVLFYALVPQPDTPRKQTSARYACVAAGLFGAVMLAYQIVTRSGCGHPLFTGLYESMLLSHAHLTWLPLAAVCFVLGDTNYRKREEKEQKKARLDARDT